MELHEENKLMREALDQIARYQADGPVRARRTLAAVGAARPPESEAAPVTVDEDKLRELLIRYTASAPGDATKAARESIADFINAWHRSKLAEVVKRADSAALQMLDMWVEAVKRAEKAEAERDQQKFRADVAVKAIADMVAPPAQPAPQAGDALGKPVAYLATDLDGSGDVGFTKDIAMSRAGYGCTEIIELFDSADIDASRREAYDKGRAEGVGQAEYRPVGYAIFSDELNVRIWFGDRDSAVRWVSATGQSEDLLTPLYAAPPASAAQQVAK